MFDPRERHYSVQDLASCWNRSEDTIRRIFRDEPGVIKISRKTSSHPRPKTPNRVPRRWEMILIPHSVAERVYRRMGGCPMNAKVIPESLKPKKENQKLPQEGFCIVKRIETPVLISRE